MASFMPGEWDILSKFGGGGFGGNLASLGSKFLGGQLGIQPNLLGTLGGIGGGFFGPLGSFAGNFLGNALGDVFGLGASLPPRARANFIYDFATGDPYKKESKVYSGDDLRSIYGITDYIGDTAGSIFETLGIDPSVNQFGFGAFKGRTGFALDTDPWVRKMASPGAYNSIGSGISGSAAEQARAAGRSFGQSEGRTDTPQPELFQTAAQAALDALVRESITKAGLTNAQVFDKYGLPTDLAALQTRLPGYDFGDDFSMDAASTFGYSDLAKLGLADFGNSYAGQMGAQSTGSAPPMNMGNYGSQLSSLYGQMQSKLQPQTGAWAQQQSYYR